MLRTLLCQPFQRSVEFCHRGRSDASVRSVDPIDRLFRYDRPVPTRTRQVPSEIRPGAPEKNLFRSDFSLVIKLAVAAAAGPVAAIAAAEGPERPWPRPGGPVPDDVVDDPAQDERGGRRGASTTHAAPRSPDPGQALGGSRWRLQCKRRSSRCPVFCSSSAAAAGMSLPFRCRRRRRP